MNIQSKIGELRSVIRHHEHAYYVLAKPEINDSQFDSLMRELENLETQSGLPIPTSSPTQRVGGQVVLGQRIKHRKPMLSLSNSYNKEEIKDFRDRTRRLLGHDDFDYICELKVDGLGVSLIYENGVFTQGRTRGDGIYGEDITNNLRTIKSIPLELWLVEDAKYDYLPEEMEVRGEVYIPKYKLEEVNQERIADGEEPFANTRNAAAGSLRLLDPEITAKRPLDIAVYSVEYATGFEFTHGDTHHKFLKDLGFKTLPHLYRMNNLIEIENLYQFMTKHREELPFDVDGIVIKINEIYHREKLGNTSKSPRWATAYKFKAEQAETMIKDIEIQVGRTGILTPVAILNTVNIAGANINHATLHNEQEIMSKDIRIGDTVIVERAGDVIPKILSVVKSKRDGTQGKFNFPEQCPVCTYPVYKTPGEVAIRCSNNNCVAQLKRRIEHFVSRNAMNIDGLGPAVVEQLIDNHLVKDIADLYFLSKNDLLKLNRMGESLASKLIENIEISKNMPSEKLLFAMGIPHIGASVAETLIFHFSSIENLTRCFREDFERIEGIGPQIADSLVMFFRYREGLSIVEKLKDAGLTCLTVNISNTPSNFSEDAFFSGKNFVLTGTLSTMKRTEASQHIKCRGGRISSSVSKKTDFVICGEKAGSKRDKALSLGITILTEQEFIESLGE